MPNALLSELLRGLDGQVAHESKDTTSAGPAPPSSSSSSSSAPLATSSPQPSTSGYSITAAVQETITAAIGSASEQDSGVAQASEQDSGVAQAELAKLLTRAVAMCQEKGTAEYLDVHALR